LTRKKLDGFLVGILPLAMMLGEDIVVKGPLSEKLFNNLTNYYMNITRLAISSFKPIKIIPDSLDDGKKLICESAVGTGFSAGIDSFFTVLRYLLTDDVLPNYKITHLVFCNVGSHGDNTYGMTTQHANLLFNTRYELIKGFPKELGIDFIKVDSNLSEVLKMNYLSTYQSRTLSCALLLQGLFRKYYYSSCFSYKDSFIRETKDISHTDSAAVHLLSTETLDCILSGAEYSRIEKTRLVALSGVANRWLNVCIAYPENGKNCSMCFKCDRTLLTLEMLGVIDKFDKVFDLSKWRKVRNYYIIGEVLTNGDDSLGQEIREYAASIGYSFPVWQRALAAVLSFAPLHKLAYKGYTVIKPRL
jgi:hypothetical protein